MTETRTKQADDLEEHRRRMPGTAKLVASLLAAAAAIWAVGCGDEQVVDSPERPLETVTSQMPFLQLIKTWDLPDVDLYLQTNSRGWTSLSADCQAIIRNPQIQAPDNQAAFPTGRVYYQKPGRVYLRLGRGNDTLVEVVGNGEKYRTDMQVFRDAYTGDYSEQPLPSPGRISLLAPDVAAAIDPVRFIYSPGVDLLPTLMQWEQITVLSMVRLPGENELAAWPASSLWLDRREQELKSAEKYRAPGAITVRVRYFDLGASATAEGTYVKVPLMMAIIYPQEQTTVSLTLSDVKLDPELPEDIFSLTQ